jgi:hypothetical protein
MSEGSVNVATERLEQFLAPTIGPLATRRRTVASIRADPCQWEAARVVFAEAHDDSLA